MMNVEQLEAIQEDINKEKANYIKTLSQEHQLKFEAVSQACKILTEAKVRFYMFPMLKNPSSDCDEAVQYNNFLDLMEEEGGQITEKCKNEITWANDSFIYAFTHLMRGFLTSGGHETSWKNVFNLMGETCEKYRNQILTKLKNDN